MVSGSALMGATQSEFTITDDRGIAVASLSSVELQQQNSIAQPPTDSTLLIQTSQVRQLVDGREEPSDGGDKVTERYKAVLSGSNINVGFFMRSPSGLSFQASSSSTSFQHSGDGLDETDQYLRIIVATQSLEKTQQEMERTCRNILRLFRNNPLAINTVVAQKKWRTEKSHSFIGMLLQLRKLVDERLLTTALELLEQKEYLDDVQKQITGLLDVIGNLEDELNEAIRDKDEKIKVETTKIYQLQAEITSVQQLSDEYIRRMRQESGKQELSDTASSMSRQNRLSHELGTVRAQLLKVRREFWENEAALRRKKYKLETEIDRWIQKFDYDMTELQEEYDMVEAQYKIEKAQLISLEERFEPLDAKFRAIMEERDMAYRARKTAEREEARRIQSAMAIQAWWRSYRVRKALAIKARKLAKLAAKGAKKKKKKNKK